MQRLASFIGLALAANATVFGQTVSVDLLDPSDGADFTGTPANFRVVDIFVDVAGADVWTGGGIRLFTENGATINYFDGDPTTPGTQPGLINGGVANQFCTSLSRPRARSAAARFTNAGATVTGAYDPSGPMPETTPNLLNVAYASVPGAPSMDGYVARISVDISATGLPFDYSFGWGVSPVANIPAGSSVVLRSIPLNGPFGTFSTTFDVPQPNGLDWALWIAVPEPSSLMLLAALVSIARRRS